MNDDDIDTTIAGMEMAEVILDTVQDVMDRLLVGISPWRVYLAAHTVRYNVQTAPGADEDEAALDRYLMIEALTTFLAAQRCLVETLVNHAGSTPFAEPASVLYDAFKMIDAHLEEVRERHAD